MPMARVPIAATRLNDALPAGSANAAREAVRWPGEDQHRFTRAGKACGAYQGAASMRHGMLPRHLHSAANPI